ncbi:MAG TPA: glycosyltransferase family 4 protein [Balneolales bacterium]|nr:glycosyltransferase family 4 protein [Balneolales bacterium]
MKLLLISQYFPPEIGAGATRSETIVRYLSELDWEIEVISELPNYPTGSISKGYKKRFHTLDRYHNAFIHRVWVWANARSNNVEKLCLFITFLFTSLLYVVQHPKKYDIVYASSPPIFAAVAGCLIAKLLRSQFVLEIRDIWPDAAVDIGSVDKKSLMYKISKTVERWLYKQSDLIVPVTDASADIIRKRAPGKNISVISNGVDLDLFKPVDHPEAIIDEPLDKHKFRVGYVGSLSVIHDLRTVVKAAKLCEDDPDIEFIIIGDGGQRQTFLNALEQEKPNNLIWLGLKNHDKIPAYISSFDVAINPIYDYEIFESIMTVKFYEYLACNTPVITTGRGLMKMIGDRICSVFTIEPEQPKLLADKIKELKTEKDTMKQLASNAREYIVKHYSRKQLNASLSELLKELVSSNGRR